MSLRLLVSREFLTQRSTLLLLLLFFIPGTLYGYYWYKDQLADTLQWNPAWQVLFVPDSPNASMFFTLAILWLLIHPRPTKPGLASSIRGLIESLAVITCVKYGVWATAIIFIGAAYGDELMWEHWMLVVSHMSMAVCGLLYARFFQFTVWGLLAGAAWTFLNDMVDYTFDVYPYLSDVLMDKVAQIAIFTFALTAVSVIAAGLARFVPERNALQERLAG